MIANENTEYLETDETGRLVIPAKIAGRYGINPGKKFRVNSSFNSLNIRISPHHLAKLYIEPTNQCNLQCRTCIRNYWDEPMGNMSKAIFNRIIDGLSAVSPGPEKIVFGGFGEPLFHPNILEMIVRLKSMGKSVELITNGTLLTKEVSHALIDARLDRLWVSLDGATPESYADVRLGAALPMILNNLSYFYENNYMEGDIKECSNPSRSPITKIGIVFVAMKKNIADLPAVIRIGDSFEADRFMVTNVLPYAKAMTDETLYYHTVKKTSDEKLRLPPLDTNELTRKPVYQATMENTGTWPSLNNGESRNYCPFIESGAGAVRWDGNLSPCLPLLHNHTSYLGFLSTDKHYSRCWNIGNIMEKSLEELWNTPEHLSFREKVQDFAFAPCTNCSGCDLSEGNEEDCLSNTFPTCGACLWAQGVIRCP